MPRAKEKPYPCPCSSSGARAAARASTPGSSSGIARAAAVRHDGNPRCGLTNESDDLVGYGVCLISAKPDGAASHSTSYTMQPEVYGVRSEAHRAAAQIEPSARRGGRVMTATSTPAASRWVSSRATTPDDSDRRVGRGDQRRRHARGARSTSRQQAVKAAEEANEYPVYFGEPEEFFIADYDEFGSLGSTLGEYPDYETVARIGALMEERGKAFLGFVESLRARPGDHRRGRLPRGVPGRPRQRRGLQRAAGHRAWPRRHPRPAGPSRPSTARTATTSASTSSKNCRATSTGSASRATTSCTARWPRGPTSGGGVHVYNTERCGEVRVGYRLRRARRPRARRRALGDPRHR